jgi:hypothetical protein
MSGHVGQVTQVDPPRPVGRGRRLSAVLIGLVLVHLGLSFVHGAAHSGARVALGSAAGAFVYLVILAGPLAGLLVGWRRPAAGALVVALAMAGSLVFGVINHFVVDGADHVARVDASYRTLFGSTAALLAMVEAAGAAVGVRDALRGRRPS